MLVSQESQPLQRDVLTRMWPSAFSSLHEIPASSGQAAGPPKYQLRKNIGVCPWFPEGLTHKLLQMGLVRFLGGPSTSRMRAGSKMLAAPGGQPATGQTCVSAGTNVHLHLCFSLLSREQL